MNGITKYVTNLYEGRIGRKNWFWGTVVCSLLYGLFLALIGFGFFGSVFFNQIQPEQIPFFSVLFVGVIFAVATIWQIILILSLNARRFHDIGESGWFSLLMFIPYVGFVACVFLILMRGEEGKNTYGVKKERRFWEDVLHK